jgi:hypothetical protein
MAPRMRERGRPPAAGERAAISGYSVQYRTSAALTLAALRDETVEWIALVDPEAGTLDDFQLARRGRLDAYQIKFSGTSGAFTFSRLKSMIGELADGWDRLRKAYPDRQVFAHLQTSQPPSRHGTAGPVGDPPPSPRHFAAFLKVVWLPVQAGAIPATTTIPEPWLPVWEALRAETQFGKRDFIKFVRHLQLDFDQQVPDPEAGDLRVDPDLKQRFQQLLWLQEGIVTDPSRTRMTRSELLQELGWTEEFEFRSIHEFPIRRDRYARITTSADALSTAISQLPGGYVAVVGTPGSGKSTLLTDAFGGHPAVVARYYAYVPNNEVGSLTRASATNFLHDVVLSLDRAGVQVGRTPVSFDADALAERFRRQLRALGDRFEETGETAYVVIDGLDHVERSIRAGSGGDTLLDRLPDPAEIPDGVFLLLGTQRTDVAPMPVRTQLAEPTRTIQMSSLGRPDVVRLASESGFVPPGCEAQLYSISYGHPLIVGYLLSGLEGIAEDEREEWLSQVPRVDGDVLALYRAYWSDVEAEDDMAYALAHIARWRGAIDLEWFATWLDPVAVQGIRRTAHHFFRRERNDRWYFFHESFRVFLLEATIQTGAGQSDNRIALRYHRGLARACARAEEDPVRWEQLHHLIESGDDAGALELASPVEFRTQAQALRALPAIASDIREATRVAVRRRDLVTLARLMIAASELGQRQYHLSWSDNLALLLIELDEVEIALDHLREDFTLRESKNVALSAALELNLRGYEVEAKLLFDLAEPLDLLRNQPEHYSRADAEVDTLFTWAEVAPRFVPLQRVVDQVAALTDESFGHPARDASDLARYYRAQLQAFAGIGALGAGLTDEVDELLARFDRSDPEEATARGRLLVHRVKFERQASADAARERLEDALADSDRSEIADWMRLRIAETLFRLGGWEASRQWIEAMDPPAITEDVGGGEGASRFMTILRYYRLRAALGAPVDPQDAVGEPRNSHYALVYEGWRAIVRLAALWGGAVHGEPPDPAHAIAEIGSVIRVLDRRSGRDDIGWYAFQQGRPELLALLVHAAAAAGAYVLEAVKRLFLERWPAQTPPDDEEVRCVLIAFLDCLGSNAWIGEELARHEATMLREKDVNGQINACFAQARAWLRLSDRDAAMRNALTGVERAAGVGYRKDYQLNDWIELMAPLLREPNGDKEIEWLGRALPGLDESTEGRASALAAEELLRRTSAAHPPAAVRMLRTLPRHGVISYADALAAFLTGLAVAGYSELAWLCLSETLVACAGSAETAALRTLAEATDDEPLGGWLHTVSARIAVHAPSATRLYWRRAIAEIAGARGLPLHDLGLTPEDLEPSERAPRNLHEESTPTDRDPADEMTTAEELIALAERGVEPDYRFEAAVERLADRLDRGHILRLRNALARTRREPLILARLARRLAAVGDTSRARELAEEALDVGRPSGWIPYLDGGTRIRPLEALAEIDPAAARERFWGILTTDAADDSFDVAGLLDSFPELIAIADPDQALPVASQARDYVHALLSSIATIDGLASDADVAGSDVAAACACVLVDSVLAGDSIRSDAGARGATEAVRLGNNRLVDQLRASVEADPHAARRVLHVVAAAAVGEREARAADATAALSAIAAASSGSDRELAATLLEEARENHVDTVRLKVAGVALAGLLYRPVDRPAEIGGAATRDVREPEWLEDVPRSARAAPSYVGDALTLGEFTTLTRLAWELPTVHREQAAVRAHTQNLAAVPFLSDVPMLHYHRIANGREIAEELAQAIIFNFTEPGDDPWSSSLGAAVSPALARRLGWRPSRGLFAWEDADGNRTCWSIWWRDGHCDRRPPSFDDVVGEGWCVLATPAAIEAIWRLVGPIERLVTITHTISYRSESFTRRLPLGAGGRAT